MLCLILKDERAKNERQKYDSKTSQRFGKIKRAAINRTEPTLCSTFAFAPTAPTHINKHDYGKP